MTSRKAILATVAFSTCLCACGTAAKIATTSTTVTRPSSQSTSSTQSTTTSNPTIPSTEPSQTSVPSTSTTLGGCAARAVETFIFIDSVSPNAAGGFTVIGNQATLVCGGPDDFHWNTSAATESATVVKGASIEVLGSPGSTLAAPIAANQFAGYMAADHNTRIFLVTGPLNAITGIQEQFHP